MASKATKPAAAAQDAAPTVATLNVATRTGDTAPKLGVFPNSVIEEVFPSIFLAMGEESDDPEAEAARLEAHQLILSSAEQLGPFRLDKIVVNKRGIFELVSGDTKVALGETLSAYVIAQVTQRSYYSKPFDPKAEAEAPDCSSRDGGVTGTGEYGLNSLENPSGRCDQCPMSKWHGKDKPACRERLTLYLLVVDDQDNVMPATLTLSPTSLAPWRDFTRNLTIKQRVPLSSVITEFSIELVEKGSNAWYLTPAKAAGRIDAEAASVLTRYAEELIAMFRLPVAKAGAKDATETPAIAGTSQLKQLSGPTLVENVDEATDETTDTEEHSTAEAVA